MIVVQPISLQPFPIRTHKEIKPLHYQPVLYAILQSVSSVHTQWLSANRGQIFCFDRLGGEECRKTLVNKFNTRCPKTDTTVSKHPSNHHFYSDSQGLPSLSELFSQNLGSHDLNKPISIKSICACSFA